jgi:hypothetical protein
VDGDTKKGNVLLLVSPVTHAESWAIIPRGVAIKKIANNFSHKRPPNGTAAETKFWTTSAVFSKTRNIHAKKATHHGRGGGNVDT